MVEIRGVNRGVIKTSGMGTIMTFGFQTAVI